jgi:hypothetical protein
MFKVGDRIRARPSGHTGAIRTITDGVFTVNWESEGQEYNKEEYAVHLLYTESDLLPPLPALPPPVFTLEEITEW